MKTIFLISILIIMYTYIGYAIIIFILVRLSGRHKVVYHQKELLSVTLIVPCFNEGKALEEKIKNTFDLEYPKELLQLIFVCDGSSDGSEQIPMKYDQILTLFSPERKGKLAAMKRAVSYSEGDILVFCDGNTVLNKEALLNIVQPYADNRVGAVTGEKYILSDPEDSASSVGEGMYWKYESFLKKYDSFFYTVVGGAGELMSYRKTLFEFLPDNTILDDFMLTMKIAEKGYLVKYVPEARASEYASSNVEEETKRKIRIAAGGWQSISRLPKAINPFHDWKLTFQYISHRVLRWTVTPFLMILVFVLNHLLPLENPLFLTLLIGQYLFYFLSFLGYLLQNRSVPIPGFFLPFYLNVMNYSAIRGLFRWLSNSQAVTWERAKRANED